MAQMIVSNKHQAKSFKLSTQTMGENTFLFLHANTFDLILTLLQYLLLPLTKYDVTVKLPLLFITMEKTKGQKMPVYMNKAKNIKKLEMLLREEWYKIPSSTSL